MNHDIIVAVLSTACITLGLSAWFYERELGKQVTIIADLKQLLFTRTCDWLDVREDAARLRRQLLRIPTGDLPGEGGESSEDSLDAHLATLFDAELMLGNND